MSEHARGAGDYTHLIECPGHGPMERLTYQGVVVRIQCRFCGQRPFDLLEREHIGSREVGP